MLKVLKKSFSGEATCEGYKGSFEILTSKPGQVGSSLVFAINLPPRPQRVRKPWSRHRAQKPISKAKAKAELVTAADSYIERISNRAFILKVSDSPRPKVYMTTRALITHPVCPPWFGVGARPDIASYYGDKKATITLMEKGRCCWRTP
eukprot:1194610-Prorocentrum_minimum.AAC.3